MVITVDAAFFASAEHALLSAPESAGANFTSVAIFIARGSAFVIVSSVAFFSEGRQVDSAKLNNAVDVLRRELLC